MFHPLYSKGLLPQGVRSGRGFREISRADPFYITSSSRREGTGNRSASACLMICIGIPKPIQEVK